jgi:hypothetical protein
MGRFLKSLFSKDREKKTGAWEGVFRPVRQPDWWQGDSEYHPPSYEEPVSELEKQLRSGQFTITAEISPPLSTATGKSKRDI